MGNDDLQKFKCHGCPLNCKNLIRRNKKGRDCLGPAFFGEILLGVGDPE